MLLSLVAASALVAPAAPAGEHGKIDWYEGTFEEALTAAKSDDKLVFIDFWTDWCYWCKRLDKDTFSQDAVAEEMGDILCLSIDAESEVGRPLAERYKVTGFPSLVMLSPDGTLRDQIGGYLPPDAFVAEVRRVRRDEDTLSGLRREVAAAPTDVEVRWKLTKKLRGLGMEDEAGVHAAKIAELDPSGTSLPAREMRLDEIIAGINESARAGVISTEALASFIAEEEHAELLFRGHDVMGKVHAFQARQAAEAGDDAARTRHAKAERDAYRAAWPHCPAEAVVPWGNAVAWSLWEAREALTPEEKAFALEVARAAHDASPDEPATLDTYACCLHLNGRTEKAIEVMKRCIELDPENPDFKERLKLFSGEANP